jgi:hypothetical protein
LADQAGLDDGHAEAGEGGRHPDRETSTAHAPGIDG